MLGWVCVNGPRSLPKLSWHIEDLNLGSQLLVWPTNHYTTLALNDMAQTHLKSLLLLSMKSCFYKEADF